MKVGEGALAGIAAGVLVGVVARIAMRMVALGVPDGVMQLPSFTSAGTASILVIGALVGASLGALYALMDRRLGVPAFWRGPLFGLVLLVTLGPLFFVGVESEFTSGGRIVLFTVLFPVFGIGLTATQPVARRVAAERPDPWLGLATAAAVGGGALIALGVVMLTRDIAASRGLFAVCLIVAPALLLVAGGLGRIPAARASRQTSSP